MFFSPPHLTKQQYRYDDPSGVAEPAPYLRPWPRREPVARTRPVVTVRRPRIAHREA